MSEEKILKTRRYIISWNNPTFSKEELLTKLQETAKVMYCILGDEIGEKEHTPHIQGYVRFQNAVSWRTLTKLINNGYVAQAEGSDKQNYDYCSKQGNYIECGIMDNYNDFDLSNIIDDIINRDNNFTMIVKKYWKYCLFHFRDFKDLFLTIRSEDNNDD